MSSLSGYDSDAIGFESVSQSKRLETSTSTQTSEYGESGVGSQTNFTKDCGSTASPSDLNAQEDVLKEYPPPGLNAFLRKVLPGVLEQLDQNDREMLYNSSDSDEEETVTAKLFQEMKTNKDTPGLGSGDHQLASILSLSWSSAGNSLAVSIGQTQHERWCEHEGLIRVYTVRRTAGDKLVHSIDITEKNCVTVVKYHPSVAALLAYATSSGEVVLCNLRDSGNVNEGMQLTSPAGCHGGRSVSALLWADASLAHMFLTMQIQNTGKRRGASDQILISAGSDGTINVWQVNANLKIFENVVSYALNGSKKVPAPDISCFDFIKSYPLRPSEEKVADDVFVVGSKAGGLLLCRVKTAQPLLESKMADPVYDVLDSHGTCVLDVAFSLQRPGIFASVSIDSELRVYDINQGSPLKVICLDTPVSCMSWLPNNPCVLVLGQARAEKHLVRLLNVSGGRAVPVEGLTGAGTVTAVAVNQSGSCRIAAGDSECNLRIWELPARRIRLSPEDLEF
ncbi:WD repeat-containing protein 34-like [Ostrinia furnacalis]|uniref:WD repeat-containing protein 34-like n=1 Tax=Ostrinia furnacalis TaxID=93504 RepID=UPI00103EA7C8|nr:WD repeat-containing protein 34-like [Ostrinia furnacalis]